MRKGALLVGVLAALALPASAGAQQLSVAQGRAAIERHEPHATIGRCKRLHQKVECAASEIIREGAWEGWTLSFTAYAQEEHGRVRVSDSISG